MARQLELLGGNSIPPQTAPIAASEPVIPPTRIASSHNGNGLGTTTPEKPFKAPDPGTKISKSIDTSLTAPQQTALAAIIDRYVARTPESKRQAQAHRRYLADPRTVSGFAPLIKEMVYPIVINRAKGSRLWDEDGHEYIDLTNGFGLNFFGWSPDFIIEALKAQLDLGMAIGPQKPLAGKVAKTIAQITGMEQVAFCNTGSEAVMVAFRIARTVTGRDGIVIFADSYHGTFDEVLVRAGSDRKSLPAAPGIMSAVFENILVLDYGTSASLEIIRNCADELAAVIVEPIQSRHPELRPQAFLQELRKITERSETALIFDEVVTGFRVAPGGAQEYFDIKADIATYGKVVGGGLPIGILTGTAKYMDALDGGFWQFGDRSIPEVGVTFFAGTFVRHPLALAAVAATLIAKSLEFQSPVIDISGMNDRAQQQEIAKYQALAVSETFDLTHGSLFATKIIKLDDREHVIIFTVHHIICDGWSLGILISDLARIYTNLAQGINPDLEPPEYFSEYAFLEQAKIGSQGSIDTAAFGHCVNFLPCRSRIDPESKFSEYISQHGSRLPIQH